MKNGIVKEEYATGCTALCWYVNDKLHREDGPAAIHSDGTKEWWVNGRLHRVDGPAIEYCYSDGDIYLRCWLVNGRYHRTNGPAIEHVNGQKTWLVNGKLHRESGPAIEYNDGRRPEWYFSGEKIPCSSQKEFKRYLKIKCFV
jgi:hypothetical protein